MLEEPWTLTLPDGARIAVSETVTAPADSELLGASPTPGGVAIYGGSDLHAYTSADGTLFLIFVGERGPGYTFGTYVLRYWRDGRREWVELPAFTEGRAGVVREPDGLYLAWPLPHGRSWERIKVPGYVTPGWPSSGKTVVAPVSITTTPAPAALTDREARDQVAALKRTVEAQAKAIAQLQARPAGGLTAGQVDDRLWAKLPDALYALLAGNNAGIVGQIRRIVGER